MFGVNCFVVQVLHRRRKRRGWGVCLCLVSIVLLFRCFIGVGRCVCVWGGGEAHPIIWEGANPPPPPNNPTTVSFNFYVKQKKIKYEPSWRVKQNNNKCNFNLIWRNYSSQFYPWSNLSKTVHACDKTQLPPMSHQGLMYLSLLPDAAANSKRQSAD